ncbi:hypothetical protein DEI95_05395 [Curtobacterium sp. MCBD17_008]|nr:hypothetical protein DEI95_05395 [Curtobacterium sp. MCBD17_008]
MHVAAHTIGPSQPPVRVADRANTWLNRIVAMKYVLYGFWSVMTGDAAAVVLLEYAAALNQAGLTDVVAAPAFDVSGTPVTAQMLLAPAVPLMVMPAPEDLLEPDDRTFVRDLRARTRAALAGHDPHRHP